MVVFVQVDDLAELDKLKKAYLDSLAAPLDGYWQAAIIDPAPHWALVVDGRFTTLIAQADAWQNGIPFDKLDETLDFIGYTLTQSTKYEINKNTVGAA